MPSKTIHAAGGIVVRNGARPLIAVVQRAKDEHWVLPRGKLKMNESALAGARREVVEETGHQVRVREFLGAITYRARGRPKVVQFWHMRAAANPSRDVMKDIMAVEWLPLTSSGAQAELPAGKTVSPHCRPPGAAPQQTAAQDARRGREIEITARRCKSAWQQVAAAARDHFAHPRGQASRTSGGAQARGDDPATRLRTPVVVNARLSPELACCRGLAASLAKI